jgi:hypothetical protein
MLAIAQAVPQMKSKSVSIFDRSMQWNPEYVGKAIVIAVTNLRETIINFMGIIDANQQAQAKENMDTAINDYNIVLFEIEKELSGLPYEDIAEVSQALSEIRLIFDDLVYPILQEQEIESPTEDKGLEEYIKEVDPNLRRHLQRLSIQPPVYEYKGHEIRVKRDKNNRIYFDIAQSDITSRNLGSIVNYIESIEKSK